MRRFPLDFLGGNESLVRVKVRHQTYMLHLLRPAAAQFHFSVLVLSFAFKVKLKLDCLKSPFLQILRQPLTDRQLPRVLTSVWSGNNVCFYLRLVDLLTPRAVVHH